MNHFITEFISEKDESTLKDLQRSACRFVESDVRTSPKHQFDRATFNKMAELGFTGAAISEDFGGCELSPLHIAALTFELARGELGVSVYLSVHLMVSRLIQRWADTKVHGELLQKIASGEFLAAFCLTEAQAGSDASALRTKATLQGSDYILNGEKIYITSGGVADLLLVFARTSDDPKSGISAFVVPRTTPGITSGQPEQKMGCEGAPITTVNFANCRIPSSALIGNIGDGYRIALSGLSSGRINIAAAACGIASRALELASNYAKERKQFGHAISEFQGIRFMLADMAIGLRAAILLTRDAAENLTPESRDPTLASIAKCFATDKAMAITTDAVQILGGAGYLKDYEVERLMRDAKMLQIVEGTNQIQRERIARSLLD